MAKKKFDYRNLILVAISILFTLGILELFLRILFSTNQTFLMGNFHDRSMIYRSEFMKVWHYPNISAKHSKDCYDVQYDFNNFGMRSKPVQLEKDTSNFRIAFMGDSFVEGYGSDNKDIFANLVDSLAGPKVEILNFGTSGGFGTVHQVAQYENFVTHFKPDLVVLFFLNYNDLHDNLKSIKEGFIDDANNFQYTTGTQKEVLDELLTQEIPEPSNPIVTNLYVFSLANKGGRAFKSFVQTAINLKADFKGPLADVYDVDEPEDISKGWQITEKALSRLHELVSKDSSKLVLAQLPGPYQLDENWMSLSETQFDKKLDPTYPNQKIKDICSNLGITYFDMYPGAKQYVDENEIGFPYFSYDCDRHPSPFGHSYMAAAIYSYLTKNEFIK